jgi:hypothetical protein
MIDSEHAAFVCGGNPVDDWETNRTASHAIQQKLPGLARKVISWAPFWKQVHKESVECGGLPEIEYFCVA